MIRPHGILILALVCFLPGVVRGEERLVSRHSVMFGTSEDAATVLDAADKAVKDGRFAAACNAYVEVLEKHYDALIETEDGHFIGAARKCEEALLGLPASTRDFLEKLVAGRIPDLGKWQTKGQLRDKLELVHRVFFWTSAGRRAREMLGDLALEEGRPLRAVYYYKAAVPWAEERRRSGLAAKLLTALKRAGRIERALHLAGKLAKTSRDEPVLLDGRVMKAAEALTYLKSKLRQPQLVKQKPKWLPLELPLKRLAVAAALSRTQRDSPHFYRSSYAPVELSGLRPAVAAGKIIIPTATGAVAINAKDLSIAWRYPSKPARLEIALKNGARTSESDIRPPCLIGEDTVVLVYDSGYGVPAIAALNTESGKPRWTINRKSPGFEELLGARCSVSEPAVAGDRFVMASVNLLSGSRFLDYKLFAVDSRGRLVWQRRIFSFYRHWRHDGSTALRGAPKLLVVDGIVVATSAQSTITAVQAETGRLLWGFIYRAVPPYQFAPRPAEDSWADFMFGAVGVQTNDGRAALLAPDMADMLVIDPWTGRRSSGPQIPRPNRTFLGLAARDKLVCVGPATSAYNQNNGARLWALTEPARGLPAKVGRTLCIPTRGEVALVDAETDKELGKIKNVMPDWASYNLFSSEGKLFAVSPRGVGLVGENLAELVRNAGGPGADKEVESIKKALRKGRLNEALSILKSPDQRRLLRVDGRNRISARALAAQLEAEAVRRAKARRLARKWQKRTAATAPGSRPQSAPPAAGASLSAKPISIKLPSFDTAPVWKELSVLAPLRAVATHDGIAVLTTRGVGVIRSDGKVIYKGPTSPTQTTMHADGEQLVLSTPDGLTLVDTGGGKARNVALPRPKGRAYRAAFLKNGSLYIHVAVVKNHTYLSLLENSGKVRWSRLLKGEVTLGRAIARRKALIWTDGKKIFLFRSKPFGFVAVDLHTGKPTVFTDLEKRAKKLLPAWRDPSKKHPAEYASYVFKLNRKSALTLCRSETIDRKKKKKRVLGVALFDVPQARLLWFAPLPKGMASSRPPECVFLSGGNIVIITPDGMIWGGSAENGEKSYRIESEKGSSLRTIAIERDAAYLLKMHGGAAEAEDVLKFDARNGKVLWRWKGGVRGILWPAESHPPAWIVVARARGRSFEACRPTLSGLVYDGMECVLLNRRDGAPDLIRTIEGDPKDIGITALPARIVSGAGEKLFGVFYGHAFGLDATVLGRK